MQGGTASKAPPVAIYKHTSPLLQAGWLASLQSMITKQQTFGPAVRLPLLLAPPQIMEVKEQAERKIAQLHSRIQQLESHNNRLAEEAVALQQQLAAAAAHLPAAVSAGVAWTRLLLGLEAREDLWVREEALLAQLWACQLVVMRCGQGVEG